MGVFGRGCHDDIFLPTPRLMYIARVDASGRFPWDSETCAQRTPWANAREMGRDRWHGHVRARPPTYGVMTGASLVSLHSLRGRGSIRPPG